MKKDKQLDDLLYSRSEQLARIEGVINATDEVLARDGLDKETRELVYEEAFRVIRKVLF